MSENCSTFAAAFRKLELSGTPKILIFEGEEVPRMALRVLQAIQRTLCCKQHKELSEAQVARLFSGAV